MYVALPVLVMYVVLYTTSNVYQYWQLLRTHTRRLKPDLFLFQQGKHADLIVSDGAPDVTGLHDMDEFMQAQSQEKQSQLGHTQRVKPRVDTNLN